MGFHDLGRRRSPMPPGAPAPTIVLCTTPAQAELIQVDALPPHRDLDHAVQLAQDAGVRHLQATPHHRANPEQPHLDLDDAGRVRAGRFGTRDSGWFGLLRGSGHRASIPRAALPRRGHHTLPHGPRIVRPFSNSLRRAPPPVSINVRRKPPLIARRGVIIARRYI